MASAIPDPTSFRVTMTWPTAYLKPALTLPPKWAFYANPRAGASSGQREELEEGLRYCPSAVVNGAGHDAVVVRARRPEAKSVPVVAGGPYGVQVPEHLFVPMLLSYARESVIDMVDPPNLDTAYGMAIKSGSPWETVGGWREAELTMESTGPGGPARPVCGLRWHLCHGIGAAFCCVLRWISAHRSALSAFSERIQDELPHAQ